MNKKLECIVIGMLLFATALSVAGTTNNNENEAHSTVYEVAWWPQYRHDPAHSGNSSSPAPNTNNVLWSYEMGGETFSSPAVVNEKMYFAEYGGVGGTHGLTCLDSVTGDFEWQYEINDYFMSSPAVIDNGSVFDGVYFVGYDTVFTAYTDIRALKLDGGFKWKYPIGYDHSFVASSPAVVDGKVYAYTSQSGWPAEGTLHCLDAEGDQSDHTTTEYWSFSMGAFSQSSPAVAEGKVYMMTGWPEDMLYCLDADPFDDGVDEGIVDPPGSDYDLIWTYNIVSYGKMSSAVVDGKVYVGSLSEGKLFCLDAEGNGDGTTFEHWNYSTGGPVADSPAVADGKVYFRSGTNIYSLDAENGSFIWSHAGGNNLNSFSAVADGKVYVGLSGSLLCLDAEGNGDGTTTEIWNYAGSPTNSPSIADGKVYIAFGEEFLCFKDAPEIPNQPDGPTSGRPLTTYTFTTVTTDPLDDQVYYMWNWGDGTELVWDGPYESGENVSANHSWAEPLLGESNYSIQVKAKNTDGAESDWSDALIINIYNNRPETPETPDGPTEGETGEELCFTTSTTDLDGDQVYYKWHFGNVITPWLGPYSSGEEVTACNIWDESGTYEVTVKAKDEFDIESLNWSDVHTITILAPELEIEIKGGIGVTAVIKNVGDVDAHDIDCTIDIGGGLFINPNHYRETIDTLAAGDTTEIKMSLVGIGLGIITDMPEITVVAECPGASAEESATAKIILILVMLQ